MKNLFYISSSGSMATKWLSKVLSTSQSMRCFHGTIGLTETYDPDTRPEVAFSLVNKWGLDNKIDYAGIVHLSASHGILLWKFCERVGVPFCALVRNPILCVDSQFQERIKSVKPKAFRVEKYRRKLERIDTVSSMAVGLTWEDLVFSNCVVTQVSHLHQIESASCPTFRFENYTTDYEEIRRLVDVITRGGITSDQQISDAFYEVAKVNMHRKISLSYQDTWSQSWTDQQRQIFSGIWRYTSEQSDRINVFYPGVDDLL